MEADDGEAEIPYWLEILLIFELVTIGLHQVLAVSLFIHRRHKWPIRGRAAWLVAVTALITPLEQLIRVLREIVPGGLGCGAVFFGLYVCTLFGISSSLVRVWRVWFEYYFACAKVALKNSSLGVGHDIGTDSDDALVKDDAVILMSRKLEAEIASPSGETSRRSADTMRSTDAISSVLSARMNWFYRYHKYATTGPMCLATLVIWVLSVAGPAITFLALPTPRMSFRGCELQETPVNSVFLAVVGLAAFAVLYTAYKLRHVADGHLIIREMRNLVIILTVFTFGTVGATAAGVPTVYLSAHLTTIIMHLVIYAFVTQPAKMSFLSDRFKRNFISSVLRKAKDNSRVSRSGSDVSLGLQVALDDPDISARFLEFLKSEWGVENYLFHQDVDNYEKAHLLMRSHMEAKKEDERLEIESIDMGDEPAKTSEEANESQFEEESGAEGLQVHIDMEVGDDDTENSPRMPSPRQHRESGTVDSAVEAERGAGGGSQAGSDESDTDRLRREIYRRAALIYYTYICSDALQQANISGLEKDEIDRRLSASFRKLPRTLAALRRLASRQGSATVKGKAEFSRSVTADIAQSITFTIGTPSTRRPFASLDAMWDSVEDQYIPLSCLEADLGSEPALDLFAAAKRSIFILMEQDCFIRFMSAQSKIPVPRAPGDPTPDEIFHRRLYKGRG